MEKAKRKACVNDECDYQGNPYLPLWEYIPDGEPYVFEDPDRPGHRRVYVYGSHDTLQVKYCGIDQTVWSAPVEDLSDWRCEGVVFQNVGNGVADLLYAPDIALSEKDGEKTYYYYPNDQAPGRRSMVCKSNRPAGPFEPINRKPDRPQETEGIAGFDPAVLIDDDGTPYLYWGFKASYYAKLDPATMATLAPGEEVRKNLPSYDQMMAADYNPADYNIYNDENTKKWGFFEASSIRKVGNKYVFVYSRNGLPEEPTGKNINQLAYGYSDSPAGPWKWGGILVDAEGETLPDGAGGYTRTFPSGNTHGSICEINGQWYIFYHRNLHTFARQGTVEPLDVEWDEAPVSAGGEVRISTAEVTSNGFFLNGLNPYKKHSAGICCYLTGGAKILPCWDKGTDTLPVARITNGAVAGIKYFNFDKKRPEGEGLLEVELQPLGVAGQVDVYLRPTKAVNTPLQRDGAGRIFSVGEGSVKLGTVELTAEMPQKRTTFVLPAGEASALSGQWGLFFVFQSEDEGEICRFYSVKFR